MNARLLYTCQYHKAVHQLVANGNREQTLVLAFSLAQRKVGVDTLAELLNQRIGRKRDKGALDVALNCNVLSAPVVRRFGGEEQKDAEKNWQSGRRRERLPEWDRDHDEEERPSSRARSSGEQWQAGEWHEWDERAWGSRWGADERRDWSEWSGWIAYQ